MGYAVELLLDEQDTARIRQATAEIGSILAEIGSAPHVSLAVFEDVDVPRLISVTSEYARRTPQLVLQFSSLGLFPGRENVLFLAPVVTRELLRIHADFHQELAGAGLLAEERYRPGRWVPHCSVSLEKPLDETLRGLSVLVERGLLGACRANYIQIIKFRPVVTLAEIPLRTPWSHAVANR